MRLIIQGCGRCPEGNFFQLVPADSAGAPVETPTKEELETLYDLQPRITAMGNRILGDRFVKVEPYEIKIGDLEFNGIRLIYIPLKDKVDDAQLGHFIGWLHIFGTETASPRQPVDWGEFQYSSRGTG